MNKRLLKISLSVVMCFSMTAIAMADETEIVHEETVIQVDKPNADVGTERIDMELESETSEEIYVEALNEEKTDSGLRFIDNVYPMVIIQYVYSGQNIELMLPEFTINEGHECIYQWMKFDDNGQPIELTSETSDTLKLENIVAASGYECIITADDGKNIIASFFIHIYQNFYVSGNYDSFILANKDTVITLPEIVGEISDIKWEYNGTSPVEYGYDSIKVISPEGGDIVTASVYNESGENISLDYEFVDMKWVQSGYYYSYSDEDMPETGIITLNVPVSELVLAEGCEIESVDWVDYSNGAIIEGSSPYSAVYENKGNAELQYYRVQCIIRDNWGYEAVYEFSIFPSGQVMYIDGQWVYAINGNWCYGFNGIAEYDGARFIFVNGCLGRAINGFVQDFSDPSIWYYVADCRIATEVTGLAMYEGSWFYVSNGIVSTDYSGYVAYDGGLFFVGAGRVMTEVNGLAQDPDGSDWYYLANGQAQIQYTGLVPYDGEWFYVINGKLAEDFSGTIRYDGADFKVENGMVIK